jgi:hypothetical protein
MFDLSHVIHQGLVKNNVSQSQIKPKKARGEDHKGKKIKNNEARAIPPH